MKRSKLEYGARTLATISADRSAPMAQSACSISAAWMQKERAACWWRCSRKMGAKMRARNKNAHAQPMQRLSTLAPDVQRKCESICRRKVSESNAYWREVAPGRFPDARPCTDAGAVCQACKKEAQAMRTYKINFGGRKIGAIGHSYRIDAERQASSDKEALAALYN